VRFKKGHNKGHKMFLRHGHKSGATTSTYWSWQAMRSRCMNPNSASYKNYGGRGISVCARWDDFANFLADMGERPPGMTLDRANNGAGYDKDNCRWATRNQQRLNSRNPNRGGKPLMDLAGKRFSRLIVVSFEGSRRGKTYWRCVCDCGKTSDVVRGNLISGKVRSCGCSRLRGVTLDRKQAA
jgi:hypothetical protein